jgi:2-octaprenyl-6-methoxyphenol hydroxylase
MERTKVDVLVCGGGIAGLVSAAAFGASGFSTLLVDPTPPVTDGDSQGSDLRSTAFLRPARDLFRQIGIWDILAPHAMPLDALRIVDSLGHPPELRAERIFRGDEVGDEPFGWNFMNWLIRRELLAAVANMDGVSLRYGTGFKSIVTRTTGALVTLSDGTFIQARLVIGADGRHSAVREAAGISTKITRYGQKTLAFSVTHSEPHNQVSTEIYRDGGPFTMVPLPDIDGAHASAIVWMNRAARAQELYDMDIASFSDAMNERSCGLYGRLTLASGRAIWPIITQRATQLSAERVALVAEAAHVLPPIGAQGLNTSLNDLDVLLRLALEAPDALGSAAMLDKYAKARHGDIAARARVIDLFNRVTRSEDTVLQAVRLAGLKAVHDIKPIRRGVMRAGLGPI